MTTMFDYGKVEIPYVTETTLSIRELAKRSITNRSLVQNSVISESRGRRENANSE